MVSQCQTPQPPSLRPPSLLPSYPKPLTLTRALERERKAGGCGDRRQQRRRWWVTVAGDEVAGAIENPPLSCPGSGSHVRARGRV